MSEVNAAVILVVDDEVQMRRFLRTSLTSSRYRVLDAETAREALQLTASHNPDLVVLDLGLPDRDGLEVVRELRGWSRVPIIVVSARGREDDKVDALDAGADDYLTKPFGVRELLARIRVALRHARGASQPESPVIEVGVLRIDRARREVRVADREVRLTPIEYKLLLLFAENAGKVLTHRQILRSVWGPTHAAQTHHVRVHVAELRKKIELDPAQPELLLTEPAVGYRLSDREPADEAPR
ncbi:MAG: response regulator [Deltaproteobacteria bacterium]|nr:response regulator [Deltaproteobacteria bacterium]